MKQRLSEQQFNRLYQDFLPPLYHAALYLLGNIPSAETMAGQAWMETAASGVRDEREFGREAARRLLHACETARQMIPCHLDETIISAPSRGAAAFLAGVCRLSYSERRLAVLSAVLNFSIPEITHILERPEWLVQKQLIRLADKLHMQEVFVPIAVEQRG